MVRQALLLCCALLSGSAALAQNAGVTRYLVTTWYVIPEQEGQWRSKAPHLPPTSCSKSRLRH